MKKAGVVLMVLCVYALHQDVFNWFQAKPLVFGFLPVGLWYHAAYCALCSVMFYILGRTVWPKHLEDIEAHVKDAPINRGGH